MKVKEQMDDEQLGKVVGGSGVDLPPQRFNVGDQVLLRIYPEYGVGKIREAKVVSGSWQYTAQFDAGMMTADEYEFIPA